MIILISPAKTLDLTPPTHQEFTLSKHLKETEKIATEMKKLSWQEIAKMMNISENIAKLNYQRYQDFKTPFTLKNAKQALFTFKGDVYRDIDFKNYNEKQLQFAQKHLRMLSGFYGILKPLDLIQPYRLEMKYKTEFWKNHLTETLNQEIAEQKEKYVVNLASAEYFKPLNPKKINATIITPVFKEKSKNGDYKIVAIHSKVARGTLSNFIIKNFVINPEDLKKFSEKGYKYSKELSTELSPTFIR